jgi:hypothetical protein
MTTASVAGLPLIAVSIAFNCAFALLAARFDYPDILREPTADVLAKFRAAGTPLVLLWWAFALTALIPFAGHRPDASTLAIVSWATWRCSSLSRLTRPETGLGARRRRRALPGRAVRRKELMRASIRET